MLPHPITPEDVVNHRAARDAQVSPDARHVAFALRSASKEFGSAELPGEIWLANSAEGRSRQLTAGPNTDQAPRWQPTLEGRTLAFISDRAEAGQRQLYLIDIETGETEQLTDVRGWLDWPLWSPNGQEIAFIHTPEAPEPSIEGADQHVEDQAPNFARAWAVNVETRAVRPLTPDGFQVYEFAWSPAGDRLALVAVAGDYTPSGWYSAQLYTVALSEPDTLHHVCPTTRQICAVTWSPDGQQIAFMNSLISDQPLWSGDVFIVDANGGQPRQIIPRDMPMSITKLDWIEPERMIYSARQLDGTSFGYLNVNTGETQELWSEYAMLMDWTVPRINIAADHDRFATVIERPDTPPQVYTGSVSSDEWRQISHFEHTPLQMGRVEPTRWRASDGLEIVGHIVYPVDYQLGQRYPTVMQIHGGPSWSWLPHYMVWWEWWAQLLAGRGYVVFLPNIRGSSGRGTAYTEANLGDMGGADFQDAMSGLDHLIEMGITDGERLGIGGWSYGGFMASWAVTQTTRFKAAIMGAGIANWESYYAQNSIRGWQTTFFGSTPYDDPAAHRRLSPMTYIKQVTTPTLILHGQEDHDVSLPQAYEMYVALKALGVDTELVTYPRENHPILERQHQIDLLTRVCTWFDRYLKS